MDTDTNPVLNTGLALAIARAGGSQSALAAKLGLRQSTVSGWTRNRVPAEWLADIEVITKVPPSLIRPDLKSILAR